MRGLMKKTIFDFYNDIDVLINTVEELRTQLSYQDDKIKRLENRQRAQVDFHRFKIIRAIMQNICQGLDEETAIEIVTEEYFPMLNASDIKNFGENLGGREMH